MKTYVIQTRTLEEVETAAMFATLRVDEMPAWLPRAFGTVAAYLGKNGVGPVGPPYARYRRVDEGTFEVEAGFPASTPVPGEGEVEPSSLPSGVAAVTVHVGPYEEMAAGYEALDQWVRDHGGTPTGPPWEVYLSDPATQPDPAGWRTEIVQPYQRD